MQAIEIRYIGHATTLLTCGPHVVLTDPHFGRTAHGSPASLPHWRSPRHAHCHFEAGALREPSVVLISHAHPNHLHVGSFKYLSGQVPVVVPTGIAPVLHPFVQNPVIELAHWVPHTFADGLTITPVPVRYTSGRLLPGLRYRLANGYLIQMGGQTIYFTGDTAPGTHFREVGNIAHIDAALLPVGGAGWQTGVINPPLLARDLLTALQDLQARHLIPIHWGTFPAQTKADQQVQRLQEMAAEQSLQDRVHVLPPAGPAWTVPSPR